MRVGRTRLHQIQCPISDRRSQMKGLRGPISKWGGKQWWGQDVRCEISRLKTCDLKTPWKMKNNLCVYNNTKPTNWGKTIVTLAGVPCTDAVDSESASRIESRLRQRLQRANQTSEEQIRLLKTVFTARRRELFAAANTRPHTHTIAQEAAGCAVSDEFDNVEHNISNFFRTYQAPLVVSALSAQTPQTRSEPP